MKEITAVALALLFCLAFCACGTKEVPEDTGDIGPEIIGGLSQITNPIKEAEGTQAFDAIGITMDAPLNAEDITYCTISDKIAQITFTYVGNEWVLRGEKDRLWSELCGVYEDTQGEPSVKTSGNTDITLYRFVTLGRLATWQSGGITYTLYVSKDVSDAQLFLAAKNSAAITVN